MLLDLDAIAGLVLALFVVRLVALTNLDVLLVDVVALEADDLDDDGLLHLGARDAPNQAAASDLGFGFAHGAPPSAAVVRSVRMSSMRARSRRVFPSRLVSSSCP